MDIIWILFFHYLCKDNVEDSFMIPIHHKLSTLGKMRLLDLRNIRVSWNCCNYILFRSSYHIICKCYILGSYDQDQVALIFCAKINSLFSYLTFWHIMYFILYIILYQVFDSKIQISFCFLKYFYPCLLKPPYVFLTQNISP